MEKSIGGLWIKEGKTGEYYSGNIEINGEKKRITVFKNTYKKDKQPDFRIYETKQKEEYVPNDEEVMQPSQLDDGELPW